MKLTLVNQIIHVKEKITLVMLSASVPLSDTVSYVRVLYMLTCFFPTTVTVQPH